MYTRVRVYISISRDIIDIRSRARKRRHTFKLVSFQVTPLKHTNSKRYVPNCNNNCAMHAMRAQARMRTSTTLKCMRMRMYMYNVHIDPNQWVWKHSKLNTYNIDEIKTQISITKSAKVMRKLVLEQFSHTRNGTGAIPRRVRTRRASAAHNTTPKQLTKALQVHTGTVTSTHP